jgi:anti-anti-sigma regulatory factor
MILQTLPANARWNLFKIEGELDFAAAPTVHAALVHAADIDRSHLVIDLEEVASADEVGVNKLASTVAKLCAERPSLHVAFVAKDGRLAEALGRAALPPSVVIFRSGSEALHAIGLHAAA